MLEHGVSFDTETHKIQPGLLAPPLVVGSIAEWSSSQNRVIGALLDKAQAREGFRSMLGNSETIIVGANIAYDMLVMAYDAAKLGINMIPEIFAAYEAGRVFDIQIAEALHAVATGYLGKDPRTSSDPHAASPLKDPITGKRGRYSLAIVTDLVLGRRDAKVNDRFRESYALLEDTPIAEWPPEARTYPIDDACNTLEVALAQAGLVSRPGAHVFPERGAQVCTLCGQPIRFSEMPPCVARPWRNLNLHNLAAQCYAAWAMHLGAAWGFAIDPDAVDALEARVRAAREVDLARFLELGYLRPKKVKGVIRNSKNTAVIKRASALAYGCDRACGVCMGSQKVPSAKTKKPVGCRACDSTGLDLDSAPVPRTKGSKCRTCSGTRSFVDKKTNQVVPCSQCAGAEDVIPGCGTSRDALTESGEEALIDFAVFSEEAKILETYIPFLRKGISEVPDDEDELEEDDE